MLRELHISNLAVISDVRIDLAPGLNCFTGATGAGKSLVIGAIEVLLGLRSPAEMLRPGVEEGRVSGVFQVANPELLEKIRELTEIDVTADGGEILLTRRLYASGRSSVSLNGIPVTLGMLKQVAENLVDVHGQHDHQYLLKPANQVDVLDQFGGLWALRKSYSQHFEAVVAAKRRITELSVGKALREQQLELYRFQADEIDAADLDAAEYARLEARASVLQNLEKLKKEAGGVYSALYDAEGSVLERLKMAAAILAEIAGLDIAIQPVAAGLRDAAIQVEEVSFDLSRYLDRLDIDPGELAEAHERLNVINRVLSKYGRQSGKAMGTSDLDRTIEYRHEIGQAITRLERETIDFSSTSDQLAPLLSTLKKAGEELSSRRSAVARKLAPLIERQLAELGMEKSKFTITLAPGPASIPGELLPAGPSGFDAVEFMAQTNPGQLSQPLRKVGSGGELSRVMLAMKSILASSDRISVLVFDEIDANVGGRLGSIIGSKLRDLAAHHQVLCITHLPQIASYADRHLTVGKEVVGGATETKVRLMEGGERIQELAEMIGGQRITDTTRAQAQELLDSARTDQQAIPAAVPPGRQRPGVAGRSNSKTEKPGSNRNGRPIKA